jgi:SAM-dependent methyltransferase
MPKLPDYGIDAPTIVRNNAAGGVLCWLAALAVFLIYRRSDADFAWSVLAQGGITGAMIMTVAAVMLWSSRAGKFRVRDRLLAGIAWRSDEQVLDIGCGRGLALIGAAKRLESGRAVGIDLWSQTDLSGNSAQATWDNARAEGVAGRIAIETGDARALPFADASFDVVVSMTAIHNIKAKADRKQAIAEAVRVLKPGGRLAMFDIFHAGQYRPWLVEAGLRDVAASWPYLLWLVPGRILTGRKG